MHDDDKIISADDIINDIKRVVNFTPTGPFKIYTSGTGFPDQLWIDFYKDINQIIVARDGTEWLRGEKIEYLK